MHSSASLDHARHDLSLIAGHAAGDLSDAQAAAAATLISGCNSCADVHRDLIAISTATRALSRTAHAPRDFRLTTEQAERLRRRSWVRTLLRPFASARSATRPMAAAFTSVGVAGLLVAVFVPGLLGGMASGPSAQTLEAFATSAPAIAPDAAGPVGGVQGAAGAPTGQPGAKDAEDSGVYVAIGKESSGGGSSGRDDGAADRDLERLSGTAGPNLLVIGSLGLLAFGIALFGLRFAARRLR